MRIASGYVAEFSGEYWFLPIKEATLPTLTVGAGNGIHCISKTLGATIEVDFLTKNVWISFKKV